MTRDAVAGCCGKPRGLWNAIAIRRSDKHYAQQCLLRDLNEDGLYLRGQPYTICSRPKQSVIHLSSYEDTPDVSTIPTEKSSCFGLKEKGDPPLSSDFHIFNDTNSVIIDKFLDILVCPFSGFL